MKIHALGPDSLHAKGRTDGQTDMTKLIVAFCSFSDVPTKHHNYAV